METKGRLDDGKQYTVVLYKEEYTASMQVDQRPLIESELGDKVVLDIKGQPLFVGTYNIRNSS